MGKVKEVYEISASKLLGADGNPYNCVNRATENVPHGRFELCLYAIVLSQITGKRLQSTTRVTNHENKQIAELFQRYSKGFIYIMKNEELTHIVKGTKGEGDFSAWTGESDFSAVAIKGEDIYGKIRQEEIQLDYIPKPLKEAIHSEKVPYKDIRSSKDDIHIIHFHEDSL